MYLDMKLKSVEVRPCGQVYAAKQTSDAILDVPNCHTESAI